MFFVVVRVEIAISICMCRFPIDVNIEFPRIARDEGIKESQLVIGSCSKVKKICGSIEFSVLWKEENSE